MLAGVGTSDCSWSVPTGAALAGVEAELGEDDADAALVDAALGEVDAVLPESDLLHAAPVTATAIATAATTDQPRFISASCARAGLAQSCAD
ncbi:hypothetical protein MSZK_22750 [Mycobacterium sp. shizuoka-1]|nr:hypothetical protein MSZK_22750 [Mycobacterium sp. shizuoka-1]